jgi:hypothetical protein
MSPLDTIVKMQDIARRYQNVSGLSERRFYSIFFSRIDPSEALVVGIKPGGDPSKWSESELASQSFYENWEHEYVDCDYPIQRAMLPLLMEVFGISKEEVRKIPKSNLAFRRASSVETFKFEQGITLDEAQREAKPFLEEMISFISPKIILLEGITTFDFFRANYCQGKVDQNLGIPIYTQHRGRQVRIFFGEKLFVNCLGREIPVIAVGHPSYFASKPEWVKVIRRIKEIVANSRTDNYQESTLVTLTDAPAGKTSLSLQKHGNLIIRVINREAEPYRPKTQRALAWQVVSLMDGLTVSQAHHILELLEPNIQGKVGRPLGWVVDAIDRGLVEIHRQ